MTSSPALPGGTWTLGDRTITRFGYGAMQLAGPGVLGPPADRTAALAVLREAVEIGITHLDTSGAYGPHITNELIREALAPFPSSLVVATKVGATRDAGGGWPTARRPEEIRAQVRENLASLGVESLDLVYLRMGDAAGPRAASLAEAFGTLLDLQREGLIAHLGLSNVTEEQVTEACSIGSISCVQNLYNLAQRNDDALIDRLALEQIAYVPFFPLEGFAPLESAALSQVASRRGTTPRAVALAWLLHRSANVLLIPGTSRVDHLRDNVAGAGLTLTTQDLADLEPGGDAAVPS